MSNAVCAESGHLQSPRALYTMQSASSKHDVVLDALRQTDVFRDLPETVLQAIAPRTVTRHITRGTVLCSELEPASALYVICRGDLRMVRQNFEGREQVVSTERAGAVVGIVALFHGGNFYSTAIADTDCELLCIAKAEFEHLCREHTAILWNVSRILAQKVTSCAEVIENLALRNVDQRLAQHVLAVFHERGIRYENAGMLELALSRAEIASRIGSTREVVSRAFTHLEIAGLIKLRGRRIVSIPDVRALSSFAGSDTVQESEKKVG